MILRQKSSRAAVCTLTIKDEVLIGRRVCVFYSPRGRCVPRWRCVVWCRCWGLLLWSSGRRGCQSSCSSGSSAASSSTSSIHRPPPSPAALNTQTESVVSELKSDRMTRFFSNVLKLLDLFEFVCSPIKKEEIFDKSFPKNHHHLKMNTMCPFTKSCPNIT